jgi:hypothetical protein
MVFFHRNNESEPTTERDITPIDVSQHMGAQELIDLTSALQPVMDATNALIGLINALKPIIDATNAFYVMNAPQAGEYRTVTDTPFELSEGVINKSG